jgi:hypothetical protein
VKLWHFPTNFREQKETKALLAAQRSRTRTNKAKRGGQRLQSSLVKEDPESSHSSAKAVAFSKKVSFA